LPSQKSGESGRQRKKRRERERDSWSGPRARWQHNEFLITLKFLICLSVSRAKKNFRLVIVQILISVSHGLLLAKSEIQNPTPSHFPCHIHSATFICFAIRLPSDILVVVCSARLIAGQIRPRFSIAAPVWIR